MDPLAVYQQFLSWLKRIKRVISYIQVYVVKLVIPCILYGFFVILDLFN